MILYSSRFLAGLLAVYQVSNTVGNSIFTQNLNFDGGGICGTPIPTENDIAQSMRAMENWLSIPKSARIMTVTVPTVFHTIRDGTIGAMTQAEIDDTIDVLNTGFSGNFIFDLIDKTDTDNSSWYNDMDSVMTMKSALHQGGCDTLNIYSTSGFGYLGFAYFPNGCTWDLDRDGVVIASFSKPGGNFPYNEGKTLTHEVGHWLGLYHTFENNCDAPGDLIDDTPAHDGPDFSCDSNLDTCPTDGKNPIENFMNYTPDACMTKFSADQFTKMLSEWSTYREGTGEPNQPNPPTTPTTSPPIVAPVTTPTDSPVAVECPIDELTVSITLDGYPGETSWSVVYSSDGTEIMSGFDYNTPGIEVTDSACVDVSLIGCMTLMVMDSYGDGFLSTSPITVSLNGIEIYNSGPSLSNFSTMTAYLGLGSTCDGYTLPPAPLPPSPPTSPPSTKPTSIVCGSNEDSIIISVNTDTYPTENSWNLTYSSNNDPIMTSFTFVSGNTLYSQSACVDSDQCMMLTVKDTWGDGIQTEDAITAVLNGEEIFNYNGVGMSFTTFSVNLGLCEETPTTLPVSDPTGEPVFNPTIAPVPDPTDAPLRNPTRAPVPDPTNAPVRNPTRAPVPDPTKSPVPDPTKSPVPDPTRAPVPDPTDVPVRNPTRAPVPDPTESPVPNPTESPVPNPTESPVPDPTKAPTGSIMCEKNESLLEIYMTTDNNGDENKIIVKKQKNNKKWAKKPLVKKNGFPSNDLTTIEKCLSIKKCYQVKITDSGKDGICCEKGEGSVRIVWNGIQVVENQFKSGKKKSFKVNCDQ